MSNGKKDTEKAAEAEKKEVTLEDIIGELPIADEHKQALTNLFTNMATQVVEGNQTLVAMEARMNELSTKANEATAKMYEGLSADQKYNIEMAKAAAPAAAAQQQLISAVIGGRGGGDSGLGGLVKSAEALTSLRNYLLPPATATQVAMEKAQISQMIAQTRLMNKLTGKAADKFLDGLEKELSAESEEE
ncbi:hypothetical protein ES708_20670 [subsurface metagenome]